MLSLTYWREALGGFNVTNWDNDAFNKALVSARSETDDAKRRELYGECQSLLSSDGGLIAPVWADFLYKNLVKLLLAMQSQATGILTVIACAERWWFNR